MLTKAEIDERLAALADFVNTRPDAVFACCVCEREGTSTFNLQAAIDACPSGGTVAIPAGTYTLSTGVSLKSNITLQGAGEEATTLYLPSQSEGKSVLKLFGVSNVTVRDLGIRSDASAGLVWGLTLSNHSGCLIERVRVQDCYYGLQAGGAGSSDLTIRDFTTRRVGQALLVGDLDGGVFERLDLEAVTTDLGGPTFHVIYLERNCHHLTFTDVRAVGGEGFAVHLYADAGWTSPSSDIIFDGLSVNARYALVIAQFERVTIRNLSALATVADEAVITMYDPQNLVVDGFACQGAYALIKSRGGTKTPAIVTLRNGTWDCPVFLSSQSAAIDLTSENVSEAGATSTTTTQAPTTTTFPTTTTTQAPTTTTFPTTTTNGPPLGPPPTPNTPTGCGRR